MTTKNEVREFRPRNSDDLCKLAEMVGFGGGSEGQLQCKNGAFVSSLLEMIDDNPDLIDLIKDFVTDNIDAYEALEDDDEEEECDG